MKKLLWLAVAAGLQVMSLSGANAADYQIGGLFPLSGPNATYGDVFQAGANLAADHINADKMLSGKLSIRYEDSQGLPQPGVVGMTKLVNVDQVPYVLSAFTGVSKAVAPIGARSQVVAINGGGVGPDLATLGDYFWNVIPLVNLEVKAVVPYLVKEQGFDKMVLLYVDDPLGQAVVTELGNALKANGGTLVDTMSVPTTAQQFSAVAAKLRAADAKAIYMASYGAQQIQIVKQLRDNGVSAPIITYSAYGVPDALALPESEGLLYTAQSVDYASPDPVTKRFVEDFKAKVGRNPTAYNVNYYNAVRLFGLLAASLEKKGMKVTGENLLAERKATKTFDLVGGTVSFQANGTLVAPIQIYAIKGGAATPVKTVKVDG